MGLISKPCIPSPSLLGVFLQGSSQRIISLSSQTNYSTFTSPSSINLLWSPPSTDILFTVPPLNNYLSLTSTTLPPKHPGPELFA